MKAFLFWRSEEVKKKEKKCKGKIYIGFDFCKGGAIK